MNQKETLKKLLNFSETIKVLQHDVAKLPWDNKERIVELTSQHIIRVLRKYIAGSVSSSDVEEWANLLELREDIKMSQTVIDAIFELANPSLHGGLNIEAAKNIISVLEK